jgi:S-adenosylmethionine hydrolase
MITLLTDFGLSDHFAGVMKGVIASIEPRVSVVDISHQVEPFRIAQARFLLAQSWPYFPKGTIHVVVVDPGVGSERRPLLVEAAGQRFVGPDNGIFSDLLALKGARCRHITNRKLFLTQVSATFHGRDIFAPVAAHLAKGLPAAKVGPLITDPFRAAPDVPVQISPRKWTGSVLYCDRFGNLVTNFRCADFAWLAERPFALRIGTARVHRLEDCYADSARDELFLLPGSSGMLEIALNQDSAARRLGLSAGAAVELELL